MARIHHNTAKKAKAHGITLTVSDVDGEIVASKDGKQLASHLSGSICLEQAIAKLNGAAPAKAPKARKAKAVKKPRKARDEEAELEAEDEEIEEAELEAEEDEDEGRSVVKKKYKIKYRPHKATCGDELVRLVRAHVSIKDEEIGEMRIDRVAMKRFAKANDIWRPNYDHLNIGMVRMNCDNRLRAKVRKGYEIKWVK